MFISVRNSTTAADLGPDPTSNCAATTCTGTVDLNAQLLKFVNRIVSTSGGFPQYSSSTLGRAKSTFGSFVLSETNSAACSGLPGVSNAFIAAQYTVDAVLMASSLGYRRIVFHQAVSAWYSSFWGTNNAYTVKPPFLGALLASEALGSRSAGRVVAMTVDDSVSGDHYPAYAIYEDDSPSRVLASEITLTRQPRRSHQHDHRSVGRLYGDACRP